MEQVHRPLDSSNNGGGAPPMPPSSSQPPATVASSPSSTPPVQSRNAYIAGLPPTFDDAQLLKLVNTYCCERQMIESIKCVMDPRTRWCRGYGFVLFADSACAQRAVQILDGLILPTTPGGAPSRATSSPSHRTASPGGVPLQARLAHASAQPTRHDITSRNAAYISEEAAQAAAAAAAVPPPPSYQATVSTVSENLSAVFSSQGVSNPAFPSPTPFVSATQPNTPAVVLNDNSVGLGSPGPRIAVREPSPKPFLVDSLFTTTMENPLFTNAASMEQLLATGPTPQVVLSAHHPPLVAGSPHPGVGGLGMSFSSLMPASQTMMSAERIAQPAATSPSTSMSNLFEQAQLMATTAVTAVGASGNPMNDQSMGSLSVAASGTVTPSTSSNPHLVSPPPQQPLGPQGVSSVHHFVVPPSAMHMHTAASQQVVAASPHLMTSSQTGPRSTPVLQGQFYATNGLVPFPQQPTAPMGMAVQQFHAPIASDVSSSLVGNYSSNSLHGMQIPPSSRGAISMAPSGPAYFVAHQHPQLVTAFPGQCPPSAPVYYVASPPSGIASSGVVAHPHFQPKDAESHMSVSNQPYIPQHQHAFAPPSSQLAAHMFTTTGGIQQQQQQQQFVQQTSIQGGQQQPPPQQLLFSPQGGFAGAAFFPQRM